MFSSNNNTFTMGLGKIRGLIAAGFVAALSLAPATAGHDKPDIDELTYKISRNDKSIGVHRVSYAQTETGVEIDIKIKVRVKIAFITAFRMDHKSREVWREGELVSLEAETMRNRRKAMVALSPVDGQYALEVNGERILAPENVLATSFTDTHIWQTAGDLPVTLLDTVSGRLRPSVFRPHGAVTIEAAGRAIDTRHFTIVNDESGITTHEFWVDGAGDLVRANLVTFDGHAITYELSA